LKYIIPYERYRNLVAVDSPYAVSMRSKPYVSTVKTTSCIPISHRSSDSMDFEQLKCGKSDLRVGLFGVEEHIPRKQDAVFFALYGEFIIRKA
jgi:hypothetical protein